MLAHRLFSLILSVTGGAQAFELNLGLHKEVRNGIVQAAISRNAWIITGGTNVFVTRSSSSYEQSSIAIEVS